MRLLIEHALSFLPLKPVLVETPQGTIYDGKRLSGKRITGVSILRAGETMEQALTAVCKDIRLGKILIQTNHDTGEPEVCLFRRTSHLNACLNLMSSPCSFTTFVCLRRSVKTMSS
ncbi:Uridine-cytidine kinase-like 1 [Ataeniobius toweri]|uniref:Uridine-cytidine kinase-like 1 n=1 Tax=Ataeniobius toweri TaxID=208326 RepID=A0ABU7AW62_9TELE|nr:Uridine-cytidine kinase-like 1 [Ataeniobius toweri]